MLYSVLTNYYLSVIQRSLIAKNEPFLCRCQKMSVWDFTGVEFQAGVIDYYLGLCIAVEDCQKRALGLSLKEGEDEIT